MGTTGTVSGGFFQKRLLEDEIATLVPEDEMQQQIMSALYDIKNAQATRTRAEITDVLVAAAQSLISRQPEGAQGIIAGCTEVPLALKQEHLSIPYLDAVTILARAAIRRAGVIPVDLSYQRVSE
jgi:aspartate racemase